MLAACLAAGLSPIHPQGSYYLLADISRLGLGSDQEAATFLLSKAGVTSVPGSSFYADPAEGQKQVRFCFAKTHSDLTEAGRRLRNLGSKS